MRPDDHAAIVGMDPLPYHRTVGAIGIVFATTPTVIVPRPDAKDAKWAEPKMVCEVKWTKEGRIRHPSFKGLREDKPAEVAR